MKINMIIQMNTSILVKSLKYITKFKNVVSLASWIYDELEIILYSDKKLNSSFNKCDFEISESIIKNNTNKDFLNRLILAPLKDIDDYARINILFKNGADIHQNEDELLRRVGSCGYKDIVELCLQNGADIHQNEDELLRRASREGYKDIVELCLQNGADIHVRNEKPLRLALGSHHLQIATLLLKYGADFNKINKPISGHPIINNLIVKFIREQQNNHMSQ